jgi:hypothetical protein
MRSVLALVVALVLETARLAAATPPPLSPEDIMLDTDRYMIEQAVKPCSEAAARDGRFGAVDVAWWYGKGKRSVPQLVSAPGLAARDAACVRAALRTIAITRYDKTARFIHGFAIGDPARVFPAGFLEALKLPASGDARRLRALLPAWAAPWRPGCVVVRGPAPLYDAALHWVMDTAGPNTKSYYADRVYYLLPDDWWLSDPFIDRSIPDLCVEHVDHAVTALRVAYRERGLPGIHTGEIGASKLDAEWVIDSHGKLTGDVAMCVMPEPRGRLSHAELLEARRELETMLGATEFGARPGFARVRLHGEERLGISVSVAAARGPLNRAASQIEQKCDKQKQLRCSRQGTDFKPMGFDPQAIDRCLTGSGLAARDIAFAYELLPDGSLRNEELRGLGKPLRNATRACLSGVFSKVSFQASTGGGCAASSQLEYLIQKWTRPTSAWTDP